MVSAFEAPEGELIAAIKFHKALIALVAIVFAVAGVGLALARANTYESAATLQIGQVNPNSAGFASFTQSSSSLAGAFSRAIGAAPVLKEVERTTGISQQQAASRLSSEPIALSPAFRVIATGPSAAKSKELADATAAAIVAYENRSNSANPQANDLLGSFRRASLALAEARRQLATLETEGAARGVLLQAEARLSAAKIKQKAISSAYVSTVVSQPPRVGFVSLLAGATTASSNRNSRLQIYGFVGLLVGIVVGCGVAFLRERRFGRSLPSGSGTGQPHS